MHGMGCLIETEIAGRNVCVVLLFLLDRIFCLASPSSFWAEANPLRACNSFTNQLLTPSSLNTKNDLASKDAVCSLCHQCERTIVYLRLRFNRHHTPTRLHISFIVSDVAPAFVLSILKKFQFKQ